MLRLAGAAGGSRNAALIRPPGALAEADFLARCIKCGQCMRVCPTNVIHPALLEAGLEGLWTPRLDFRIGTSGCQHNCIACGQLCPTAAIRPLSLDERLGRNDFSGRGALRIGTAFVDRGRCLPWAMDTPCIVCQENCPVSPKAIFTREFFATIRDGGALAVAKAEAGRITLAAPVPAEWRLGTGDYVCETPDGVRLAIASHSAQALELTGASTGQGLPAAGERVSIQVRLQQPFVDPGRCIGCGVCEHECPVQGLRAIRVTSENESRTPKSRLII